MDKELLSFTRKVEELLLANQSNREENIENEGAIREDSENGKDNNCEKCDFVGKTEGGLKTHMTTKHKTVSLRGYRKT